MTALLPQLADQEMAALVEVEAEFARRAQGSSPWSDSKFLDEIQAVHVRFNRFRHYQQKAVAA
ncbi:hypothetical protein OHA37_26765 [Streptomyces sp. NBC_00335]|uniref:hypothetical protein n=1 Tax=unclassified Streptomyces TaxID=2593676 RepID=UPI00225832AA|nr:MULTISPECIES: hypothetical protein [unclassified Streptomyces]MCX5407452.1 hypothetical protein [Streptomyces sp. NBC_00086]